MLDLNIESKLRCIKGNEPLLLNDPDMVWVVHSGTLALFATSVEDGEPKGNRHYLFSVSPGEALFGTALFEQWGILAVAIEETELSPVAIAALAAGIAENDECAIALLEGWSKHLGDFIRRNPLLTPVDLEQTGSSRYLSLQKGHTLTCSTNQVLWVQLGEGYARWMGIEDLKLEITSPKFPLAAGMWVEAEDLVEVHVVPTTELENFEQIPTSLACLHEYFLHYLNVLVVKRKAHDFRLFQEREELNRQVTQTALGELTTVLHPQETAFFQEGTPLLIAAGAVGRALGITINPPAQSEDLSRVSDPLDAIARASRFRTRRVLLVGDWWREEHGPLLAYTNSDKSPVALLPQKGDRYVLFDPSSRTRTLVNRAVAQTLWLEAQMFYRPLPLHLRNSLALFEFGTRGNRKELVGVVLLGILGTLLGMVTPQATAMLVNDAIPDSNRVQLLQIGLALFAAAIGQAAFQMAQGILTLRVENSADAALQPAIWDRLLTLKPAFFRSYSSGDLLTRLLAVSQIRAKLSGATQRTLLSAVFSLLNLALMFVYSVQLALVGFGITLIAVIVTVISSILLVGKNRKQEAADGEINGLTVELINGVSKLRVAAAEGRAFAAWAKKYSQRTKLKAGIKRIDDSVSVFNEALPLISSILLYWFAILFIQMAQAKGGIGLNMGTFLAFNSAFGTFISGVTDLSNTLTDVLGIVPLWERAKPIATGMPETDPSSADPGRLTGRIVLDHITFRYREDGPLILDDVTIYADPGEFVAIVGPSGSGKSTVFRLLLGFETPLSGTVYYDGQDLAGLDVQAVRRQLGVVLQNGRINSGSMFDNLTCGALVTMDEAWEAARMSGFAADIEQMPMGMHTVISEGGTNLSGGQRQRLLIARSILLKPKIILMDEATSALDNRTQAIVTESLDKLNATRIVIAHRLSTIRNADRIYVVEAGRLVEVGSYAELVKQGGLFARLVARQID
ncbi:NHLP bacteriocin export ABC transporter permease/ATPase subunit [Brasilonema sp. UFV-L1]|uniref:NHLP bacteriocin export ABC transporter permease/ATPase subunit n=1 Tax=Brasilonema sp. UFV-L1 TaxID=2234130 RepID=UPI001B7D0078|nr:NHLP bacteriocin export ABC transporter permease/ATPase subunit [Brasilonema sp. UFV-L1]